MADPNYKIRTMTRSELDTAVDWAATEGWNPGLCDADCFYMADPNGFFIGLLENKPVATISAVRYGDSFGFIGFYIVRREYRGKGYGIGIWKTALKYLEGRNIGGDGVVAQQENYKKTGFFSAWRTMRHEGRGMGVFPQQPEIVNLSDFPLNTVLEYDLCFFPAGRTRFLTAWISQDCCKALGFIKNGGLKGYGVIRKCRTGYKIGPLFADGKDVAEALLKSLISGMDASEPFYLDTPETNHDAVALAESFGMKVMFETARMYNRESPAIPIDRLFGITSFELG